MACAHAVLVLCTRGTGAVHTRYWCCAHAVLSAPTVRRGGVRGRGFSTEARVLGGERVPAARRD
eukprot:2418332-Rhodomonas_salina.1